MLDWNKWHCTSNLYLSVRTASRLQWAFMTCRFGRTIGIPLDMSVTALVAPHSTVSGKSETRIIHAFPQLSHFMHWYTDTVMFKVHQIKIGRNKNFQILHLSITSGYYDIPFKSQLKAFNWMLLISLQNVHQMYMKSCSVHKALFKMRAEYSNN